MEAAPPSSNDRADPYGQTTNAAPLLEIAFARIFGRHLSRMQSDA